MLGAQTEGYEPWPVPFVLLDRQKALGGSGQNRLGRQCEVVAQAEERFDHVNSAVCVVARSQELRYGVEVVADSDQRRLNGAIDGLRGLKENVIVGRLIPAGTGLDYYRSVQLSPELEEAAERVKQEVNAEFEAAERELEMMRQEGEAEEMAAE